MTMVDIVKTLRELDEKHRDDGDGGYALLADVREYRRQLPHEKDQLLQGELIRLVEEEDATLRGVALETLVQEWGTGISQQLADILTRSHLEIEWEGHLLLALLRLGHSPIEARAVEYISQRLMLGDRTVLPMVAALVHINKEQCLSIATMVIVNANTQGYTEKLEGYIPAFVRNFVEVDLTLLKTLVHRVSERDAVAGRGLANMLRDYFDRKYVQDDLGIQVISQLQDPL